MKIQLYICTLFSLIQGLTSTTEAQQVKLKQLTFKSAFEKEVFTNHSTASPLELFLAISPEMTSDKVLSINREIKSFVDQLKLKKFESKKEHKKIKTLFDQTHASFLTKYEDVVNFGEIFNNKSFNCVSGSALYALILNDFKIPYVIKESPTHIYVVVNPNGSHIVLESTLPNVGFIDQSDHYIKNVLDQLIELKLLTQDEVDRVGYRSMYNNYFFSEDTISIRALASIQYSNEAISYIEEDNNEKAIESIFKAQFLYESKSNHYILTTLLGNALNNNKLEDSTEFSQIVEYSNYVHTNSDYIVALYKDKAYEKIFNEGEIEFVESMTNYFTTHLLDTSIIEEINFNYNLQKAGYYQAKSEWEKSLEYAEKAYQINPKNVNIENIITVSINNSQMGKQITQKSLDELMGYQKKFSFLEGNSMLINLLTRQSSYLAIDYLRKKDLAKSKASIKITEELIKKYQDKVNYNEDLLVEYYFHLSEYYYQRDQYSKGSQAIKNGLILFPNNEILKKRRNLLTRAGYY